GGEGASGSACRPPRVDRVFGGSSRGSSPDLRESAQGGAPLPNRARRARLHVEALESREVPYATTSNFWPHSQLVTLSFVPDGTVVGSERNGNITSNLFSVLNAKIVSARLLEHPNPQAVRVLAQQTTINFALVNDSGADIGSGANQQGDPNFGDIRIGGYNFGTTTLAQGYMPPPVNNYSVAGDIQLNTGRPWNIGTTY